MVSTLSPQRVSATADVSEPRLLTAEEYLVGCKLERSELINGRVVELTPPGGEHGGLAVAISSALHTFVRQHLLGRVLVEAGFKLQCNPDTVRGPDVAFIEASRLPEGRAPRGFIEGAPTMAVEILSPGDLWSEVEDKVRLYLDTGARAVWIVDPASRTVTVRTTEEVTTYGANDTLPGGAVLPGFELPLSDLFDYE